MSVKLSATYINTSSYSIIVVSVKLSATYVPILAFQFPATYHRRIFFPFVARVTNLPRECTEIPPVAHSRNNHCASSSSLIARDEPAVSGPHLWTSLRHHLSSPKPRA